MKILQKNTINISDLAQEISSGKTFIYPTETCYGLGSDATNHEAVEKVFEIKGREKEKPCILLFRDILMLRQYAVFDQNLESRLVSYWPGALTVLLPILPHTNLSPLLIPQNQKISCRISSHPFLQKLFEYCNTPIISTSANFSGQPSIYEFSKIKEAFLFQKNAPDICIDAGDLPFCPASTIIEIKDGKIEIHRQGNVYIEE